MSALTLIIFFFQFTLAQNICETKSVDVTFMPKNQSQDDLEWCFAFSASNILSFYEKTPLSAYDIALKHHLHPAIAKKGKLGEIFGSPSKAMMIAGLYTPQGICQEESSSRENSDWARRSRFIQRITDTQKSLSEISCDYKNESEKLPKEVLTILDKLNSGNRAAAFLDVTCQKHQMKRSYKKDNFHYYSKSAFGIEKLKLKMHEMLNKEEPTNITYSIGHLLPDEKYQKGEYVHASTLVAKRWNPDRKTCEFKLRDSYSKKDCSPKNLRIRCEGPDFWIDEEVLLEGVAAVETIEI
jgi:hypothetical protein